jgi:UDP-glucuronate decarboxylase
MKYLVAGGTGFLGANLCLKLLKDGHEIIALDNLSTGKNVLHHFKGYEFVRGDITEKIPRLSGIAAIYNLACPASPPAYQSRPIETWKASTLGVLHLAELATKLGCPLLQASTSEIYGDPATSPQAETDWGNVNPIGLRSCYDEGKRAAEALLMDYQRQYGTNIKLARIFNTYGPRMAPDDGRVVSNFIVQALNKQPLTVYGTGTQTRSYCYVDDLIEGLIRLMESQEIGPINLGNPMEYSVAKLAENINLLTGNTAGIVFKPLPSDDPRQRRPDITRAKELLGWNPKVGLHDGLSKTVAWFKGLGR